MGNVWPLKKWVGWGRTVTTSVHCWGSPARNHSGGSRCWSPRYLPSLSPLNLAYPIITLLVLPPERRVRCVPNPTSPGEEPGGGRLSLVHSYPSPDPELLPGAPAKFLFLCLSNITFIFVYSWAGAGVPWSPGPGSVLWTGGLGWREVKSGWQ